MTEESPQQPKHEYIAAPQFVADTPSDVVELLRRAGNYHEAAGNDTIAAELRRGADVLDELTVGDTEGDDE